MITNVDKDVGKFKSPHIIDGNAKWCGLCKDGLVVPEDVKPRVNMTQQSDP